VSRLRLVGLAVASAVLPGPLFGQRAPVLQQVKVPHPYYFREMFIPQPTSGPSSVAWSPDGRELVYSMQGSLWRQRLGSTEARQLTDGPGYDYQPDWSPDGRQIVYGSYRRDEVELRVLNLASGESTPLVSDGSVNLEPRWSPDGRRIAFTSTAYLGRWHVFVVAIQSDGRAATTERVTEEHDSKLPRYYYHRFDQYLSPSWSPDGRELLLVSNRGHVWGSGGFWRVAAHAGATPGELRYEETTWKARPDWGWGGNRVVYSSYLGTSFWGHVGLLGLDDHLLLPGYAGYANTAASSLQPTNAAVLDLAHAQGATTGYVHPFDSYPDPSDSTHPLTAEFPVDVALGKVDYYEALGFVDDPMATARVWYQILNCGFALPAGAGTDAMANFASLRGPVGMNRVFVRSGAPLEHRRWLSALKAGRSFATNGPLLEFTINGRGPGDTLGVGVGERQLRAHVSLRSNVPVDHLEIVGKGEVVREIPLEGNRKAISTSVALPADGSGWFLLRARTDSAVYPVLDLYPYATTSPIYTLQDGKPVRSAKDARYFIAWIDRLVSTVQRSPDWNSEAEKQSTLEMLRAARAEFERRATD
jgi:hypothetical protein